MPYVLETSTAGSHFFAPGTAIVVNTQTGKHYSTTPIPLKKAKAQKRVLEAVEKKQTVK